MTTAGRSLPTSDYQRYVVNMSSQTGYIVLISLVVHGRHDGHALHTKSRCLRFLPLVCTRALQRPRRSLRLLGRLLICDDRPRGLCSSPRHPLTTKYIIIGDDGRAPLLAHPAHARGAHPHAARRAARRPVGDVYVQRGLDDKLWNLLTRCWVSEPEQRPNIHQVLEELPPA